MSHVAEANIIVYTIAYNAQNTIRTAMESVLNQTYGNFIYYVLDNGSEDNTRAIMQEYAQKDGRVRVLTRDTNSVFQYVIPPPPLQFVMSDIDREHNAQYFAELDADDEYMPDFLEKTLEMMEENDLDIVAAGTQFVSGADGSIIDMKYAIDEDLIIYGDEFKDMLKVYLQFMWTIWNKLYRFSTLKLCKFERAVTALHSGDTMFATEAFKHAKRVGILGGIYHKYYIYPKAASKTFNEKRISSDPETFDEYLDFLNAKNAMTKDNMDYIQCVHLNSVRNTITVLLSSDLELIPKLTALREAYTHEYVVTSYGIDYITQELRNDFHLRVASALALIAKSNDETVLELVSDILAVMPTRNTFPELAKKHDWNDRELLPVLLMVEKKLEGKDEKKSFCAMLNSFLSEYPILTHISRELLMLFVDVAKLIMEYAYDEALERFIEKSDGMEVNDDDMEGFLSLALSLSAAADNTGAFIFYKKLSVLHMIESSNTDKAKEELSDLLEMLPEDEELLGMLRMIEGEGH